MDARPIFGCLLLSLALILVAETALDGTALRAARRPQWRAGDHAAVVRVAPKSQLAGAAETSSVAVRDRASVIPPLDRPVPTTPHPGSIFVPPRV